MCASIGALPRLTRIDLRGQSGVTLQGLQDLSGLRGLRAMALENCPAICNQGLALIAAHTGLTSLWLKLQARISVPLHAGPPGWHTTWCSYMQRCHGVCLCAALAFLTLPLGCADALAHLASLSGLASLRVGANLEYGTSCKWTVLQALTALTSLDFSWCNHNRCVCADPTAPPA